MNSRVHIIWCLLLLIAFPLSAQTRYEGIIHAEDVRMRRASDKQSEVVAVLQEGAVVEFLAGERLEYLKGYGMNAWTKVRFDGQVGYVYAALLHATNEPSKEKKLEKTAYINSDHVNIRYCPSLDCAPIYRAPKGLYIRILSQTKQTDNLAYYGSAPWYYVQLGKRKGYIYGGAVELAENTLKITQKAPIFDKPNERLLDSLSANSSFRILVQSKDSEIIRPYGRNFWYKIALNPKRSAWIYGGYTSKHSAPVDCQCVDFVKNKLDISGPTKNALEWEQVLTGQIEVQVKGKSTYLNYKAVTTKIRAGDIAVFDKQHFEADREFGHIGFVKEISNKDQSVLIIGANHDTAKGEHFTEKECLNVSTKRYALNQYVRFFRN